MITLALNIIETNDSDGLRNNVLSHDMVSVDSFNVAGGSTCKRVKMLTGTVIKISDLVDLDSVSSITIASKSSDSKIYPLFDISTLDINGDVQSTQRLSVYSIVGVQGLTSDLQIDNMEERGANPEINILITIKA